jgi:DsbC/DsbD-like thiol-disulfide interchange protein
LTGATGFLTRSALVVALAAVAAQAALAQPSGAPRASVRFVAAGDLQRDAYRAAIVIDLAPDTITYWRNPGEAGVPPTFDFSGSDNLAQAEVALPAPTRIKEAGGDVFGYSSHVAYAVSLKPMDPTKPLRVDLKMDYAACEKICIPMHAEARLQLAPDGKPGPDAKEVSAAEAALPRKVAASDAATVTRAASAEKPTWRVAPKAADAIDLFPEAPERYFFETSRAPDGSFLLMLADAPKDGAPPSSVRLTMTKPAGAIEFEVGLD